MSTKLFVARLSFDSTNDSLQKLFEEFGTVVSARIIVDRDTSRSKGFGFVEMGDEESAQAAIKALDGFEFEGRNIAVSEARPQQSSPNGGGGRSRDFNRGGSHNNNRRSF
jgi:RNA recognition motif-containing protein